MTNPALAPPEEDRPAPAGPRPLEPLRATTPMVVAALGVALLADRALFAGWATLAMASFFTTTAIVIVATARPTNRSGRCVLTAVPLFAIWLAVRTSPWVVSLDILACLALLTVGVTLARRGRVFDTNVPERLLELVLLAEDWIFSLPFLGAPLGRLAHSRTGGTSTAAAVRGAVLALPILILLAALLASADVVFAQLFQLPVFDGSTLAHAIVMVLGLIFAGGLLRAASSDEGTPRVASRGLLGSIEAKMVLGGLVGLYTLFAGVQLVTAAGGADHVLETAGLTRAEYARSGFFQLLWAAGITLAVLTGVQAGARRPRDLRGLSVLASVLTIAIVAVAVIRLDLYADEYGLTMLRFFSMIFALWIGLVFILFALSSVGLVPERRWFVGAVSASAFIVLFGVNVMNPEAFVARANGGRAITATRTFDAEYANTLSADAMPALVGLLDQLDGEERDELRDRICGREIKSTGWLDANLAVAHARSARSTACEVMQEP